MVRSMYSGVSGMRVHQTAMDTIGNNIANVNTYGFKGSRTTFADIYYQSLRGASGASATRGGVNASQVGVGSQVRSVDVMMTRSSFTQTDMGMDIAIDGEGFLQVMDADGNKYYTRAGQLLFDANGNLVDSKGNFVLGTNGETFGVEPGSSKIQVALGSVNPTASSAEETINNVKWTVSTSNPTDEGNVGISFVSDTSMDINDMCIAEVTDSGIIVTLNGNKTFTEQTLSDEVNKAIQKASHDLIQADHPAGNFTITAAGLEWGNGLTGSEICSTSKKVVSGTLTGLGSKTNGFSVKSFGSEFGDGIDTTTIKDGGISVTFDGTNWVFTMTLNEAGAANADPTQVPLGTPVETYTATIPAGDITGAGSIKLAATGNVSDDNYISLNIPDVTKYIDAAGTGLTADAATKLNVEHLAKQTTIAGTPPDPDTYAFNSLEVTPSYIPTAMGLASKAFTLTGGTKGGPQGIDSLTGVSIGTDGVITGHHENLGDVTIGRIDLAVFVNPSGLTAAGGTYFATSPNSGTMNLVKPGTGGSGQVVSGSLELSNVDLSREFTDMIKTQRGYQANSRIITVTDTMLEELVNLKR